MRIDYLSPTLYLTDILVGLIALLSLPRFFPYIFTRKNIPYLLIVFFLLLGIFLSANIPPGLYHLLKFLEFSFVAYYVFQHTKTPRQLLSQVLVLSCGVILQSALALWQYVHQSSIGGLWYFLGERLFTAGTPGIANASINGELILRPYGTFPHPNVLAGYLLVVLLLGWFLLPLYNLRWQRWLVRLSLLVGTGGLFLTLSRVAILLWVGFLLIVLGMRFWKRARIAPILLVSCLLLLSIITPVGSRLLQTNLTEESVVQREQLVGSAWHMIVSNPLQGVGLGNFLPTLAQLQPALSVGTSLQPVHNIYFLITAETGLIGFSCFIWFLFLTFRVLLCSVQKNPSSLPSLTVLVVLSSLLILGLFDHYLLTLQQGQLVFAYIIGLSWSTRSLATS